MKVKKFYVTLRVSVWAHDAEDAISKVKSDMVYLTDTHNDGDITGFRYPTLNDVSEDKEV